MKMISVYIGIGSNIDKRKNIQGSLNDLKSSFSEIKISPIYQSKPIGMIGDDFYNLVVKIKTSLGIEDLELKLREIEYRFGRKRNQPPHTSRTLDIDLLLFGDIISSEHNIQRDDITNNSFVLKPLCHIEQDLIHPVIGEKISTLWEKFDISTQPIKSIEADTFQNI